MAQSQQSFIQELDLLADFLSQKKEDILEDWTKILEEDEEQFSKIISLSREKFYNHIPWFLERVCENLRQKNKNNSGETEKKIAREHAALRWEYGLDLRETTKEWAELHQVLMTQINLSKDTLSLSPAVLEEAQKIVVRLIHEGILNSIHEYYRLQNLKAEAEMHDLEAAVHQQKEEKLDHSRHLQQTSHDLKGILYSLQLGFSLLKDEKFSDKTAEIINEMSLATDGLDQLLNDLLDLFRLEAGKEEVKITSLNVTKILNEVCHSLRPLAQARNLDLRCKGTESLSVEGDQNKLRRIAQNLLINALKYTREGHVEMNWELKSEEDWLLCIRDTGPGLSSFFMATGDDTSEPSQNSSASGENEQPHGEGIGLQIVRQLCRLLDAVIDIETAPNKGTTFRIVFPLSYPDYS